MSSRKRWRERRSRLLRGLVSAILPLVRLLGWRGAQRLGATLGAVAWRLDRKNGQRALDNLEIAFPEASDTERRRLAGRCARHLGTTLGEALYVMAAGAEVVAPQIEVEGWEEIEAARARGRGILILTGHCGHWEILGIPLTRGGLEVSAVAREMEETATQEMVLDLRREIGTRTIARGATGSARRLLAAIRGKQALAMLIDQDTRVDGTWVPFFGRLAFTPLGAAELVQRADLVVIPSFIERRPDGTHLARFLPALDLADDPREATALMTNAIEDQIRRVPEQWVWMHRRWRRRPPEEEETTSAGADPY